MASTLTPSPPGPARTPGSPPGSLPGLRPRITAGTIPRPRAANIEAQQLTGRPYISHSQLAAFRGCPRKFAFIYIENAPREFLASSLLFGSAAHAAFEFHFRCRLEGVSISAGDLLHVFMERWKEETSREDGLPVRFNRGEDMGTITALAERMITVFLESPLSRPSGQIVGIEESFRVVIDDDLPDILARVDLVTQTDDALHVVDLKTSRSRWSEERAVEGADQLHLYGRTVGHMAQGVGLPVKLHFGVITKARIPTVQVLDLPTDEARLAGVREGVLAVWRAAKAGNYFANPSPQNCATCPFRGRCPAYAGR